MWSFLLSPLLVCTLFWVSQFLDAFTIKLVKCLIKELKRDREYELANTIVSVENISNEMKIGCMFVQKLQIHRKKILVQQKFGFI